MGTEQKMVKPSVEILTVNYNTPELIKRLIDSRDEFCPEVRLKIIDGSEDKYVLRSLLNDRLNYTLDQVGYNIHHGRGLHRGIKDGNTDYVLLMDSDSYFINNGCIDYLISVIEDKYTASRICEVNKDGFDVTDEDHYLYPHPSICLINRKIYTDSDINFINHGAPAINIAIAYDKKDVFVDATDIDKYALTTGRGTVNKFGYGYEGINTIEKTIKE